MSDDEKILRPYVYMYGWTAGIVGRKNVDDHEADFVEGWKDGCEARGRAARKAEQLRGRDPSSDGFESLSGPYDFIYPPCSDDDAGKTKGKS
jgi:hypothetical protein